MPTRPLHIVVAGPQGSGKGPQSTILARRFGLRHVSSGDLLRAGARADGPNGDLVRPYLEAGALVPSAIVDALVIAAARGANRGVVFDGYPRTVAQAELLDRTVDVDLVIALTVPEATSRERLASRRSCDHCGAVASAHDPEVAMACHRCGATMRPRADDVTDAIRMRMAAFERETVPVLERYRQRELLATIDASGAIDDVAARVARVVIDRCELRERSGGPAFVA
jgi:adenylate kinase